jgi:hypothetical protein
MNFRLFLTTKRLLLCATKSDLLATDATYKLMWQGFPLLLCGTIDKNKAFHPICLMISKHETEKEFKFMFVKFKKKAF